MKPSAPCRDCVAPERHIGCRNACDKWAVFQEQQIAFRRMVKSAEVEHAMIRGYKNDRWNRNCNGSIAKFAHAKQEEAYEKMHRIL